MKVTTHDPLAYCCICNNPVCTYEWGDCPDKIEDHKNGVELNDGRWVCSDQHFDVVTKLTER